WIMESETKQIGQYTCFKATATKTVDAESGFNFRRPPDDEKTDAPTTKNIQIVAWYTMQIPVNQGPSDYWGLPGLILEVSADKTIILCSKIVLNPEVKDVIKVPSKGKEITKIEYDEIVKKKMKNEGYSSLVIDNENMVFKKDNALFYLKKDSGTVAPISLPNLLINQFFVTNETLYIYSDGTLYQFQLKIN
uniref:GLPGLI family protein n=1 Tax=Mariniflexile sp. TaxID=1979402 RepID=UPI004048D941